MVIRLTGTCGKEVYVNEKTIAYVTHCKWDGAVAAKIKFSGGTSLYVKEDWWSVVNMIEVGELKNA